MTATPAAAYALVQPLSDWAFGPAPRRNTRQVRIGGILVGGDAPVVVQSMTNTDTADVASTVKQVADLWRAGSELVRVTVNNPESAAAVPRIVEKLAMMGIERSEEHTSELQSLMRTSYAVFCLTKTKKTHHRQSGPISQ